MSLTGLVTSVSGARGAINAAKNVSDFVSPGAVADRASARALKQQADEQLRRSRATAPSEQDLANEKEAQSLLTQQALQQARAANAQVAQTITYSGFDKFEADGDPRHINAAFTQLRQNPIGADLFSDVTRVDKIGPGDEALLEQYGITLEDFQKEPDLNRMFLRATKADGTTEVFPVEALYAGTNYTQFRTQRDLELAQQRADIFYKTQMRGMAQGSATERTAHLMTKQMMPADFNEADWAPGNPEYDAIYLDNIEAARARPPAETQSEAEATRETMLQRPEGISESEWVRGNEAFDSAYQTNFRAVRERETRTAGQREQVQVRSIRDSVLRRAEDQGTDFFAIDFSKRENRLKYEQDIQDMARLGRLELSAEDKRKATYIRELIHLGGGANITDQEAGLVDSLFRNVSTYIKNDVPGIDATAAYAAFRNTIRHALFGSTLTDGEIAAFNEQFGTLGQQAGPVLTQLKNSVEQVRSQLQSMMNLGDSLVSHFYLGADEVKIAEMIESLDERLDLFTKIEKNQQLRQEPVITRDAAGNPSVSAPRPSLDDIYARTRGAQQ